MLSSTNSRIACVLMFCEIYAGNRAVANWLSQNTNSTLSMYGRDVTGWKILTATLESHFHKYTCGWDGWGGYMCLRIITDGNGYSFVEFLRSDFQILNSWVIERMQLTVMVNANFSSEITIPTTSIPRTRIYLKCTMLFAEAKFKITKRIRDEFG